MSDYIDRVVCPYQEEKIGGYLCRAANLTGEKYNTNKVLPDFCDNHCWFFKIYKEIKCIYLSPYIELLQLTTNPISGLPQIRQRRSYSICSLKRITLSNDYKECLYCGYKSSVITRRLYTESVELLENANLPLSAKQYKQAREYLHNSDYEAAITATYSFVEVLLNEVLDNNGVTDRPNDINKIWKLYRDNYIMKRNYELLEVVNSLMGLQKKIGEVRNKYSLSHGNIESKIVNILHAELVINAASSIAVFVARLEIGGNDV